MVGGCATPQVSKYIYEDEEVLYAYDALNQKMYMDANRYFEKLYANTKNEFYYEEAIRSLLLAEEYHLASIEAVKFLETHPKHKNIRRHLVFALQKRKEFESALGEAQKLIDEENSLGDYELVGDILIKLERYRDALNYFESAYALNHNDYALDKIATLTFVSFKDSKKALAYYETHIRLYGCGEYLCQRLSTLYAKLGNVNGVIATYRRLYDEGKNEIIGKKLIDLYLLQKDYYNLGKFLEESHIDDEMLFNIYKRQKAYLKAAKIALIIYEKSGNILYYAQNAMLSFEFGDQKDSRLIDDTIDKLSKVILENENPLYLNYLGYILIDYDRDVARGIRLVEEALVKSPENLSYLDSLAWGYYKQKKIKKAYNVILKLKEHIDQDTILKEHYLTIEKKMKEEK
jgi:tetratricopeptide (TPR) repeat protein